MRVERLARLIPSLYVAKNITASSGLNDSWTLDTAYSILRGVESVKSQSARAQVAYTDRTTQHDTSTLVQESDR